MSDLQERLQALMEKLDRGTTDLSFAIVGEQIVARLDNETSDDHGEEMVVIDEHTTMSGSKWDIGRKEIPTGKWSIRAPWDSPIYLPRKVLKDEKKIVLFCQEAVLTLDAKRRNEAKRKEEIDHLEKLMGEIKEIVGPGFTMVRTSARRTGTPCLEIQVKNVGEGESQ